MVLTSDLHIGFKRKVTRDILDFYDTRSRMYENVYFHHTTQKIDKIYFCMMKRLGVELFKYGEKTDDYNIETLLRSHEATKDLMDNIDNRKLDHNCDICKEYNLEKTVNYDVDLSLIYFVD